jgi:hypothetical protein
VAVPVVAPAGTICPRKSPCPTIPSPLMTRAQTRRPLKSKLHSQSMLCYAIDLPHHDLELTYLPLH